MKERFNNIFNDKMSTFLSILALGIIFFSFLLIFLVFSRLPEVIPLFYSLPWGEKQLASKYLLILLPSLALGISLINLIIGQTILTGEIFYKRILAIATMLTSFLAFYGLIKIVLLFI